MARTPASLAIWLVVAIAPFVPVTWRLATISISALPQSYLACIPVVALGWAAWNLWNCPDLVPVVSARAAGRVAVGSVTGGLVLVLFVPHPLLAADALLLWPVWAAVTLSALWGWRAVRACLAPLAYLVLAWPPPYLALIAVAEPTLVRWSYGALIDVFRGSAWLRPIGDFPARVLVASPGGWVRINITGACSGVDSLLALVTVMPIALVVFRASALRRVLLVAVACVLAFAANLARIAVILWATHTLSVQFAFHVIHPLLGPVLFAALVFGLLALGGLAPRPVDPRPAATDTVPHRLTLAYLALAGCAVAAAFVLTPA